MVLVIKDVGLLRVEEGVGEPQPSRLVLLQVGVGDVSIRLLGKPKNFHRVFHRKRLLGTA
jgi:hypothetical protein